MKPKALVSRSKIREARASLYICFTQLLEDLAFRHIFINSTHCVAKTRGYASTKRKTERVIAMNCHGNQDENNVNNEERGHKGHKSHMLMMLVCCGAPLLLFLVLPLLRGAGYASGATGFLPVLLSLICPVMMMGMMFMMMKGNGNKTE